MPFGMINYVGMIVSIVIIFVGFLLMVVDNKFVDAKEFSISLHVAPVVIILGYAALAVAIMLKPGGSKPKAKQAD
jgi:hypothetical protein